MSKRNTLVIDTYIFNKQNTNSTTPRMQSTAPKGYKNNQHESQKKATHFDDT